MTLQYTLFNKPGTKEELLDKVKKNGVRTVDVCLNGWPFGYSKGERMDVQNYWGLNRSEFRIGLKAGSDYVEVQKMSSGFGNADLGNDVRPEPLRKACALAYYIQRNGLEATVDGKSIAATEAIMRRENERHNHYLAVKKSWPAGLQKAAGK